MTIISNIYCHKIHGKIKLKSLVLFSLQIIHNTIWSTKIVYTYGDRGNILHWLLPLPSNLHHITSYPLFAANPCLYIYPSLPSITPTERISPDNIVFCFCLSLPLLHQCPLASKEIESSRSDEEGLVCIGLRLKEIMGRAPCCDKANVKRGPWSPDEDAKLKAHIEKYGTGGNWIALPRKIGKPFPNLQHRNVLWMLTTNFHCI